MRIAIFKLQDSRKLPVPVLSYWIPREVKVTPEAPEGEEAPNPDVYAHGHFIFNEEVGFKAGVVAAGDVLQIDSPLVREDDSIVQTHFPEALVESVDVNGKVVWRSHGLYFARK